MSIFHGRGVVPLAPSDAPVVTTSVVVSFGSSNGKEEQDSEATPEGTGKTSPPCKADLLCALPDDDDAGDHPVREVLPSAGVTTRSKVTPSKKLPTVFPTKSRSILVSQGDAPALASSGAAVGPATASSSAPGARILAP